MPPQLAAFPKGFLDQMTIEGGFSLDAWIDLSATLDIDGLEFYNNFFDLKDSNRWSYYRRRVEEQGRSIPMLCCSSDFTHPDPAWRRREIEREKRSIDLAVALGVTYCRVLSGQRRPEVGREEGLRYCVDCITECLEYAAQAGIKLILENHYKDNHWLYPEFAQKTEVFCDLIGRIEADHFGVNFDPSNTLLAGEDPLLLLRRVKHRVFTMHASDRYLKEGTIEDLRREENVEGYARRLSHGVIGQGLNDYDAIFAELKSVGFNSWISIEDGVESFDQLVRSAIFLRRKIAACWPGDASA